LAAGCEADMADEAFVQDLIDEFTVVNPAGGKAFEGGKEGARKSGHSASRIIIVASE